jgi:hypothetical protein
VCRRCDVAASECRCDPYAAGPSRLAMPAGALDPPARMDTWPVMVPSLASGLASTRPRRWWVGWTTSRRVCAWSTRWRTETVSRLLQAMLFPACAMQGHELGSGKRNGNYSERSCFCGWNKESHFARRGQDMRASWRQRRHRREQSGVGDRGAALERRRRGLLTMSRSEVCTDGRTCAHCG